MSNIIHNLRLLMIFEFILCLSLLVPTSNSSRLFIPRNSIFIQIIISLFLIIFAGYISLRKSPFLQTLSYSEQLILNVRRICLYFTPAVVCTESLIMRLYHMRFWIHINRIDNIFKLNLHKFTDYQRINRWCIFIIMFVCGSFLFAAVSFFDLNLTKHIILDIFIMQVIFQTSCLKSFCYLIHAHLILMQAKLMNCVASEILEKDRDIPVNEVEKKIAALRQIHYNLYEVTKNFNKSTSFSQLLQMAGEFLSALTFIYFITLELFVESASKFNYVLRFTSIVASISLIIFYWRIIISNKLREEMVRLDDKILCVGFKYANESKLDSIVSCLGILSKIFLTFCSNC